MTNYERLKTLSIEEMAEVITSLPLCGICNDIAGYECSADRCRQCAVLWLNSEHNEEQLHSFFVQ